MFISIVLLLSMFAILFLFGKTCIQQKRIEELEYVLLKDDKKVISKRENSRFIFVDGVIFDTVLMKMYPRSNKSDNDE